MGITIAATEMQVFSYIIVYSAWNRSYPYITQMIIFVYL